MNYKVYKISELPEHSGGFFDSLVYVDSGAAVNYSIDEDYLSDSNSRFETVQSTRASPKNIIALIENDYAVAIGVITSVDNVKRIVTFRSLMNLFDTDILNPYRSPTTETEDNDDSVIKYVYDGVVDTKNIILKYFASESVDKERRLPLEIVTSGEVECVWTYTDNTINVKQWLIDLFVSDNIVCQFSLEFTRDDTSFIRMRIAQNTTQGDHVKDNVYSQEIVSTEKLQPESTACWVLDSKDKSLKSTWYLLIDNTITENAQDLNRMYPYIPVAAEIETDKEGVTDKLVAEGVLLNNTFNHQIKIRYTDKKSSLFPSDLSIGDRVKIIQADGMEYDSIYTGRQESSTHSEVMLIFGKVRTTLTAILLKKFRSR